MWTDATVIAVTLIVNLRRVVEAWIVRRGELYLEAKRLELQASLINDRESRRELSQAQRLIDAAREGGAY